MRETSGTETRILNAAREIFAERGRRRATVREICTRAKVNVAAVNYHFGSKDKLYAAALQSATTEHFARHPIPLEVGTNPTDRLRTVIAAIASTILAPRPAWHDRLLMAELSDPSPALDRMVRDFVRPRFDVLCAALKSFLPNLSKRELELHALSVSGQLFYYKNARAVVTRLLGMPALSPGLVAEVVEHVTDFTLRAIGGKR